MKILFIYSANKNTEISPIVQNQMKSLIGAGLEIDSYPIKGKGILGYLKYTIPLRKKITSGKYDIIHAHYALCGFLAGLLSSKPVITSLMGSEILRRGSISLIAKFFTKRIWSRTIVKSKEMAKIMNSPKVVTIPNGVNFDLFQPLNKAQSQKKVGFNPAHKNIIFVSNPERSEKNYDLALKAMNILNNPNYILHTIFNITNDKIPEYLNASDLLLLTSLWEGSPNVIKEAMACNCPIVATNVGDIQETLENTPGCYITTFEPENVAENIKNAILFSGPTNGRNKIKHLENKHIANLIINTYKEVMQQY